MRRLTALKTSSPPPARPMPARMGWARLRDHRGFTLVEVMVGMTILMIGVLGTVALIDGANAATSSTKAREGATNLARDAIELARTVPYEDLTTGEIGPALRAKPGLGDSDGDPANGWTIQRRGITYTVTAESCILDDERDKAVATHDASFCAGSATSPVGDPNPDDYRRLDVRAVWRYRSTTREVQQSALVVNPAGGLGPRITSLTPQALTVGPTSPSTVAFSAQTSTAASLNWMADDGVSGGDAAGGPTSWTFSWDLGPAGGPGAFVRDGTYLVSAQAFDPVGIPGDVRSSTITVNRSAPFAPTGLDGGRNPRFEQEAVELEWAANEERDVKGYRAYWAGPDQAVGGGDDVRVCPAAGATATETTELACVDASRSNADPASYYVRAVDVDTDGNAREGAPSALLAIANTPPNAAPAFPSGATLSVALVDGLPRLTWTAASDPDAGDSVRFYRIYRDTGTGFADRYDRTAANAADPTTYTDREPADGTRHRYWVTAVDDRFAESQPLGPVTTP